MDTPQHPLRIRHGYPEDQADFQKRNLEFIIRFHNLEKAIETTFDRVHEKTTLAERTVYFLGRITVEEFMEILLLCQNGYGVGAQKLLRGMYERAVTAEYLFKHSEQAEDFLAYNKVANYKILESVRSCAGHSVISKERTEQIEQEYEAVRPRFLIANCKKCETTRVNHSWNKKDLVSMARESVGLWPLLPLAYQIPMRELHTTVGSIFSRLDPNAMTNDEGLLFESGPQPETADFALHTAHLVMLCVLENQREVFKITELPPLLQTCMEDVSVIYRDKNR